MSVRWPFMVPPALALALSGACGPRGMPSPYLAYCPAAESAPCYPVVVTAEASVSPGKAWLDAAAHAAAYRWIVPSRTPGHREQWRAAVSRMVAPRRVVQYDIDARGRVIDGSLAVIEGPDAAGQTGARQLTPRSRRYQPAFSNCRPIALTVIRETGG